MSKSKNPMKESREFGLTVGIAFIVLGALLLWRHKTAYPYMFGVGTALVLLGLVVPAILSPIQKAWMAMAKGMGWVMTNVILSITFFLVLTPISFAMRLCGKRPLDLKIDRSASTYWHRREAKAFDPSRCESQY
jgi:hypothetical protein